jgi:pimeloyl-ACP methyl ester carboxylesterase
VFVPIVVLLVLSLAGTGIYFSYRMIHPERKPVINTPEGYQQILKKPNWDERTWPGADGTEVTGWLFFHNYPAPVVILSHGYGANREEMLSTGYRLWDAGYQILAYDLRAHGESSASRSTLGPEELRDLKATIEYAKTIASPSGAKLSDGRVALYGVDLGGAISLTAAAENPEIKAVAIDSVYPSQDAYYQYLAKSIIGAGGPPGSSFVEGSFFQSLLSLPLRIQGVGGESTLPIQQAIAGIGNRPLLMVVSKSSRLTPFAREAATVASAAPNARVVELERTRTDSSLIKDDAKAYDDAVVNFFTTAPDFAPPPRAAQPVTAPAA